MLESFDQCRKRHHKASGALYADWEGCTLMHL